MPGLWCLAEEDVCIGLSRHRHDEVGFHQDRHNIGTEGTLLTLAEPGAAGEKGRRRMEVLLTPHDEDRLLTELLARRDARNRS